MRLLRRVEGAVVVCLTVFCWVLVNFAVASIVFGMLFVAAYIFYNAFHPT